MEKGSIEVSTDQRHAVAYKMRVTVRAIIFLDLGVSKDTFAR